MSDKNSITISNARPSPEAELIELQLRREKLHVQQLERQELEAAESKKKVEDTKAQVLTARKTIARAMEVGRENRKQVQAYCTHIKENGKTAVQGQRDSHRVLHWLCQACMKEWTGVQPAPDGLPFTLHPDPETVGGPNF